MNWLNPALGIRLLFSDHNASLHSIEIHIGAVDKGSIYYAVDMAMNKIFKLGGLLLVCLKVHNQRD